VAKDLTVKEVAALRTPGKHRCSRSLYIQIGEGGGKSWLFRFERFGRARWHGIGSYDLLSLADARERVLACRKMLLDGVDPIEARRAERQKAKLAIASTMTFRACGEAYIRSHEAAWRNLKHRQQWRNTLTTTVNRYSTFPCRRSTSRSSCGFSNRSG
jgi:Arm DNA-binding domain